jgi:hypothetical protein
MSKALVYTTRFFSAGIAAFVLFVFVRDELGISRHSIVIDALTTAGVLGLACGIGVLRGRK